MILYVSLCRVNSVSTYIRIIRTFFSFPRGYVLTEFQCILQYGHIYVVSTVSYHAMLLSAVLLCLFVCLSDIVSTYD